MYSTVAARFLEFELKLFRFRRLWRVSQVLKVLQVSVSFRNVFQVLDSSEGCGESSALFTRFASFKKFTTRL